MLNGTESTICTAFDNNILNIIFVKKKIPVLNSDGRLDPCLSDIHPHPSPEREERIFSPLKFRLGHLLCFALVHRMLVDMTWAEVWTILAQLGLLSWTPAFHRKISMPWVATSPRRMKDTWYQALESGRSLIIGIFNKFSGDTDTNVDCACRLQIR